MRRKNMFLTKTKVGKNMYKHQFVYNELHLVMKKDENNWCLNDFESYFCLYKLRGPHFFIKAI